MSEKKKAGMILDIYRAADGSDCTNDGLSSVKRGHTRILLIGSGDGWSIPAVFEDHGDLPVFRLVERNFRSGGSYFHAEPADNPERRHVMAGGNFAYSHDSRIRNIVERPIPLHDRMEG
jgi:hypothetical protein